MGAKRGEEAVEAHEPGPGLVEGLGVLAPAEAEEDGEGETDAHPAVAEDGAEGRHEDDRLPRLLVVGGAPVEGGDGVEEVAVDGVGLQGDDDEQHDEGRGEEADEARLIEAAGGAGGDDAGEVAAVAA